MIYSLKLLIALTIAITFVFSFSYSNELPRLVFTPVEMPGSKQDRTYRHNHSGIRWDDVIFGKNVFVAIGRKFERRKTQLITNLYRFYDEYLTSTESILWGIH